MLGHAYEEAKVCFDEEISEYRNKIEWLRKEQERKTDEKRLEKTKEEKKKEEKDSQRTERTEMAESSREKSRVRLSTCMNI